VPSHRVLLRSIQRSSYDPENLKALETAQPKKLRRRQAKRKHELEASLEAHCVKVARERKGWLSRKMNGYGFNHWPDRQFLGPLLISKRTVNPKQSKATLWVEFKRFGEQPTPAQADIHKELRRRGQRVEVVDNREQFYKLLEDVIL
jgi:hypothetical protein